MPDSNDSQRVDSTRRTLLGLVGGGTAVGLAGCLGGDDDEGNGNENGDENGEENGNENGDENGMDNGEENGDENGDENGEENGGEEVVMGGELNMITGTLRSLDPITSTDSESGEKINQAYENLTHYPNGETRLENQLLESVEISDDLLTYTFSIREGVPYHDNPIKDELTAHDFKYAWRRLAEAEASQRFGFVLSPEFLGIEHERDDGNVVPDSLAIEIVDDYTFEATLAAAEPAALDILAYNSFAAMPQGLVGDIEGHDGEWSQEEIAADVTAGTGPFELDNWEGDAEIRMTAFDDYWGEGPYVDSVHWAVISEQEAMWTYSVERNTDFAEVPTEQYDPSLVDAEADDRGRQVGTYGPIENGDTLNYIGVPSLTTFYVAFNAPQVPQAVRQAVAYVTDHEEVITDLFKGRGQTAFSFTPPSMWPTGFDAYQEFRDSFPYSQNETDIEGAQEVLQDAGYTSDDPFQLTYTSYQSSDEFSQFGRLTRDKLSGLGIEMELENAPFSALQERGENGNLQFYSLGWGWSWVDPAYGLFGFEPENTDTDLIPEEADGYYLDWNKVDSENADKAQEAWERVVDNPSPEAEDIRAEAFVEIEEAARDDMVLLPLYHRLDEYFPYQWVNAPRAGALGSSRIQHNTVWLDEDAPNREP